MTRSLLKNNTPAQTPAPLPSIATAAFTAVPVLSEVAQATPTQFSPIAQVSGSSKAKGKNIIGIILVIGVVLIILVFVLPTRRGKSNN